MRPDTSKMTSDELAEYHASVDWRQRYSVGRAIAVGTKGEAPADSHTRTELARAISRLAVPKRYAPRMAWAVPIGGEQ